ncbi:ATP-binding protein [Zhengella sp. ZM62]
MSAGVASFVNASLGRRFLVLLVGILTFVSLCFLALVMIIYRGQLIADHARASMEVNHLLEAALENAMLKRDIPGLRDIVDRLGRQERIAGVTILDPHGEIRFTSTPHVLGTRLRNEQVDLSLADAAPRTAFVKGPQGGEWLRSINPVRNQPACRECHGPAGEHPVNGVLVVDYDAAGIRSSALRTAGILGLSGLVVILASGIALWFAVNRLVLARISRLRAASEQIAGGVLGARAPVHGHDEIGSCAVAFNRMAGRIEAMLDHVAAAERSLQSVIDSIPDGIRVIDGDFNILKANDAYCRQVNQEKARVIGEKCYRSSHGRSEPCPHTVVTCPVIALQAPERSSVKFTDAHLPEKDGQVFVEVSAARADIPSEAGVTRCVVESIRDLSQDVVLSQKHRLSEIGLLATGVAHEIHNPLSSIELALSAIQDTMPADGLPGTYRHYIDIARTEIDKCLSVTESLMRLAEPPRERELVPLDTVIPDVMALLSFQFLQAGIEWKLAIEPGLRVLGADSDLRMIAVNLTQNAIHAMPEGGTFHVGGTVSGGRVVLRFSDTGTGIASQDLERIFLPFWSRRADGTTGRGLGLSICKAIVERYGGSIMVISTLGEGTEFMVTLPAADA